MEKKKRRDKASFISRETKTGWMGITNGVHKIVVRREGWPAFQDELGNKSISVVTCELRTARLNKPDKIVSRSINYVEKNILDEMKKGKLYLTQGSCWPGSRRHHIYHPIWTGAGSNLGRA